MQETIDLIAHRELRNLRAFTRETGQPTRLADLDLDPMTTVQSIEIDEEHVTIQYNKTTERRLNVNEISHKEWVYKYNGDPEFVAAVERVIELSRKHQFDLPENVACPPGCAECCSGYEPFVSGPDVQRIADHLGLTYDQVMTDYVVPRESADGFVVGWLRKVDEAGEMTEDTAEKCVFLKGSQVRPLLLRHLRRPAARLPRLLADRLRGRRLVAPAPRQLQDRRTVPPQAQARAKRAPDGSTTNGRCRNEPAYDVAIVGGGHNGLVAAAYCARAGLRTVVLERRDVLGGATLTEEVWPGYRLSVASYVCSLLDPRIVAELDLRAHGYDAYRKDPASFTPLADGRSLLLGRDDAANAREVAAFDRTRRRRLRGVRARGDAPGRALADSFDDPEPSFAKFPTTSRRARCAARRPSSSSATCARRCSPRRSRPTG